MTTVETIGRIRRSYFVQRQSVREIARRLHVSRKTVRKAIEAEDGKFSYDRTVQPMPKLGAHVAELERLLAENERKPRRERLTLIRLFEALRAQGYEGGYDTVRRHARRWQREEAGRTATAFVPLSFEPGEAYQFDWSHEVVVLAGVTTTVKVAHMRLCHSRMFFVRAYPRETQEMVFDAHDKAFAFFGGACARGIGGQTSMPIDTFCGNVKYGCAIALPETCNSARFQQFLCDVSTASTCGRKNRTLSKLVTCVHVCA